MKIILYMTMTANGYIAKEDDETPWSDIVWESYCEFVKKRGNIVVGKRTYEIMKEANEFEKLGFPITVVVSDSTGDEGADKIFFVSSPKEAVAVMKEKGMDEMVVGGGSTLNTGFLEDGLLDEIYLDIEPRLFGKGIKLFSDTDISVNLRLCEVAKLSKDVIRLHYRVLK